MKAKKTDSSDIALKVEHVSKSFRLPTEKANGLKQAFINRMRGVKGFTEQHVLEDISFEIKKGDFFGIVGRNGSGKSTLLKLISQIYTPDSGKITVNGSLVPFIELGVGFNPELTGRENIYLNGALLGFSRSEIDSMYDDIVEFAELGRFMDQKLKNYSSGMQVRLAFSIAIRAKSDILLLDEVLAVGDAIFQKKCYDYFKQLKREGKTVIFVSHDTGALQEYCTNGILLEKSEIIKAGPIDSVVKGYLDILNRTEKNQADSAHNDQQRWGSGQVTVKTMTIGNTKEPTKIFSEEEPIVMTVAFQAEQDVESPVFGITITSLTGQIIFQSNTLWCQRPVRDMKKGEVATCHFTVPNVFNTGTYLVSPAVSSRDGVSVYDWREDMVRFKTTKQQKSHGIVNAEHQLIVEQ